MDKLSGHQRIALDFDGTLVDGVASATLAAYVKQHSQKSFSIVTFRTPTQIDTIPTELTQVGLSIDMFLKVVPMPKRLAFDFDEDQKFRRHARLPNMDQVSEDALLPGEYKFVHWKGFIARKLGATVLVDDFPELVTPGCKQFGIAFIDAKDIHPGLNETKLTEGKVYEIDGGYRLPVRVICNPSMAQARVMADALSQKHNEIYLRGLMDTDWRTDKSKVFIWNGWDLIHDQVRAKLCPDVSLHSASLSTFEISSNMGFKHLRLGDYDPQTNSSVKNIVAAVAAARPSDDG